MRRLLLGRLLLRLLFVVVPVVRVRRLQRQVRHVRVVRGREGVQLTRLIAQHAKKFSAPVIGPVGEHIKLKANYAKFGYAIERTLGGAMRGFIVQTHTDRKELDKLKRKAGVAFTAFPTFVRKFEGRRYVQPERQHAPAASFRTVLRGLNVDNAEVYNLLIDVGRVHQKVLCESQQQMQSIPQNSGRPRGMPRNVQECSLWDGDRSQCVRGAERWIGNRDAAFRKRRNQGWQPQGWKPVTPIAVLRPANPCASIPLAEKNQYRLRLGIIPSLNVLY